MIAAGVFADENAGTGKNVTVSYSLSDGTGGGLASNYSLADEVLTADITPKQLTISGTTVANKIYDRNTSAVASASGANLSGLFIALLFETQAVYCGS